MNLGFANRNECPCCFEKKRVKEIYNVPYSSLFVHQYLESFYGRQGGIDDFSVFADIDYSLMECENCGLIFQRNIPNAGLMLKLYEEYIDPVIKEKEIDESGRYNAGYFNLLASEVQFLQSLGSKKPSEIRIFDYGMGWGMFCRMAIAHGMNASGSELSLSRKRYVQNQGIKVMDINDAEDEYFDIINFSDVLEHLPDPALTIAAVVRKMKPGGLLRISVPGNHKIKKDLKKMEVYPLDDWRFNCVAPLEHINCFFNKTLLTLCEKNGLGYVASMDFLGNSYKKNNLRDYIKGEIKRVLLRKKYIRESTNLVFQKN